MSVGVENFPPREDESFAPREDESFAPREDESFAPQEEDQTPAQVYKITSCCRDLLKDLIKNVVPISSGYRHAIPSRQCLWDVILSYTDQFICNGKTIVLHTGLKFISTHIFFVAQNTEMKNVTYI